MKRLAAPLGRRDCLVAAWAIAGLASWLSASTPSAAATPLATITDHYGLATASADSYVWKYERYGGVRGSHGYHWVPVLQQNVTQSVNTAVGQSSGTLNAVGKFYAPKYSATALSSNATTSTATQFTYTVQEKAWTMLDTPQVSGQEVAVSSGSWDEMWFTLNGPANVTLKVKCTAGMWVKLTDITTGDVWAATSGTLTDNLEAGNYELSGWVSDSALQDTLTPSLVNLGKSTCYLDYTMTLTPGSADGGGGGN